MNNENDQKMPCPCKAGKRYDVCCKPFHQGKLPDNALKLMRSRYSAYALCLPSYIISTTHPASPQFYHDATQWSQKISEFCANTEFNKLEILGFQEKDQLATVTFVVHFSQNKKEMLFTERSYFEKIKEKWFYRSGQQSEGHAPHLLTTNQLQLLPLVYYGSPILRKIADPITSINSDVHKLVEEMIETMDACDGLGLAAPQIDRSVKIFVIRKPVESEGKIKLTEVKVFINPELSEPSKETWKVPEGCLSIPSLRAEVERPREITVEYTNLEGNKIKERVFGWEARAVMHENDHINGVLFIDHLDENSRKSLEPFLKSLHDRIHKIC